MKTADEIIPDNLGLWWSDTPKYHDHHVGCLGIPDSLSQIEAAETRLREKGCTIAIGPMEGNTWRSHRAIIESDKSPPFLLEPFTTPEIAGLFRSAGYDILARYSSSQLDLRAKPPNLLRIENRFSDLEIRSLDIADLEKELQSIYHLSTKAFLENFLYTPISQREFIAQYSAFKSHLNHDCALLAEHNGQLVGFVFGYPDQDRFVVKTLAVLPERKFAGLGTLLVDRIQKKALQAGFTSAIHALQREDNQSLRISKRFNARVFRKYALFAKTL